MSSWLIPIHSQFLFYSQIPHLVKQALLCKLNRIYCSVNQSFSSLKPFYFSLWHDYQQQMFTAPKHKVRARSVSFWGSERPSWTLPLIPPCASEVVTHDPSHSMKGPLGGKEHRPRASHFLWKYLLGHSSCPGYIRFSYCKHRDGLLGGKVKASYVDRRLTASIRGYLDNCADIDTRAVERPTIADKVCSVLKGHKLDSINSHAEHSSAPFWARQERKNKSFILLIAPCMKFSFYTHDNC